MTILQWKKPDFSADILAGCRVLFADCFVFGI